MAKIISATTAVPLAYTDVTQRKQKTTTSSLSCSAFPIQLLSLQPLYILHPPELSFSVYIKEQKLPLKSKTHHVNQPGSENY